jgi:hypothetical protein
VGGDRLLNISTDISAPQEPFLFVHTLATFAHLYHRQDSAFHALGLGSRFWLGIRLGNLALTFFRTLSFFLAIILGEDISGVEGKTRTGDRMGIGSGNTRHFDINIGCERVSELCGERMNGKW